eukprot:282572-Chlamydomonas_euryale.AAC.1
MRDGSLELIVYTLQQSQQVQLVLATTNLPNEYNKPKARAGIPRCVCVRKGTLLVALKISRAVLSCHPATCMTYVTRPHVAPQRLATDTAKGLGMHKWVPC